MDGGKECEDLDGQQEDVRILPADPYRRDRLVSAMLQDRGALRLISAPLGYGKSALSEEYARRLFGQDTVSRIDAAAPMFLHELDAGRLLPDRLASDPKPVLVIVDDLPFLDEERSRMLSHLIDLLLYEDVEVIVTTVPSHDCLRALQPDRVLVSANDLLVSEEEFIQGTDRMDAKVRSEGHEAWVKATASLFGLAPAVIWGGEDAISSCLQGVFDEQLPLELLRGIFCMMLMGSGDFDDLVRMGLGLHVESEKMLINDYPFLGIDPIQRAFKVPDFPFCLLAAVIEHAGLAESFTGGTFPLPEKILGHLLERGDTQRAGRVLEAFCSDERCALWLSQSGWDLLDKGEIMLVDTLFVRCPERMLAERAELMALRAWTSGLMGDIREAGHFARRVLRARPEALGQEQTDTAGLAAYLAHLAFCEGGPLIYAKGTYMGQTCVLPEDFLAGVVDLCSEAELARAFCIAGNEQDHMLTTGRGHASLERMSALESLFTNGAERFHGHVFYRLGLHFLQHVGDGELRSLLQDLGTGVVSAARRKGLDRFSEALLVCDLWCDGYFGVSGHAGDTRDAHLLEEAAQQLMRMGNLVGDGPFAAPWESDGLSAGRRPMTGLAKSVAAVQQAPVPTMHVRLFGGFEVTVGERLIQETEWRKKGRLLFAMLVFGQGRDVARDALLAQLWPTAERPRALDSFYSIWSSMVALLGEGPYLERNGEFCRINHRHVSSDVAEFEQLARRLLMEREEPSALLDVYARLESLYRGGLMPGETDSRLIKGQRERYRSMYTDAMVVATNKALEAGDARVALWFARKGLEEDDAREDVYHALIQAQIAAGQRCSAIRTYFRCREYLREELGLDPSRETQELYSRLISIDPALLKLDPSSFQR